MRRQIRSFDGRRDGGMALVLVLIVVIPFIALATSAITVVNQRSSATLESCNQEFALDAAESGIDLVLYRARTGKLDIAAPLTGSVRPGLRFEARVTDLATDGEDNDGDTLVDEYDEQIYLVESTGYFRGARRSLLAHIARIDPLPSIVSAVQLTNGMADLEINGASFWIRGTDTSISGDPGGGSPLPGIVIADPGNPDALIGRMGKRQQSRVDGLGGAPSVKSDDDAALPVAETIEKLRPFAHNALAGGSYREINDFGEVDGPWRITLFDGDTQLGGELKGAGVMIVNGNLAIKGNVQFVGLVIVKGNLLLTGGGSGTVIRGGVIVGGNLTVNGTVDIEYSREVAEKLHGIIMRRVLRGWWETARQ